MGEERGSREREKGGKEHEILQKTPVTGCFRVQGKRKGLEISGGFFPQKVRGDSNKYLQSFLRLKTTTQKYP